MDPDPDQIVCKDPDQSDKLDPDPHQGDKLDPDPNHFADDQLKFMEYESI